MASSVQNSRVSRPGFCGSCKTCNTWCWRAFKWLPVLLIVTIMSWSYYAYVIELCGDVIENTVQKCIYLVLYHILLIMFSWSYWKTIFADIKPIPGKFKLPDSEHEKLLIAESEEAQRTVIEGFAKDLPLATRLRHMLRKCSMRLFKAENKKEIIEKFGDTLPILTRTMSGSVRYCNRCIVIKPDRAHHCSICRRCVMKMDHHCPWVNNCVCYHNYKFFMLFLGYALIYCLFFMATCLPYFISFWQMYQEYKRAHCDRLLERGSDLAKMCVDLINGNFGNADKIGRYHIVFAFFISLMFAISLGSLFGYHCYLVANNRTTLDMIISYKRISSPTGRFINSMCRNMLQEAFRAPMFRGGPDKNGFSLGCYKNFKEVFGNNPNLWLVPVFTSLGDGCEYPVRMEHQLQTFTTPPEAHSGYESMGTTRSSFGDGIVYPNRRPDEESESLLNSEQWERWGEQPRPFDEHEASSFDEL